MTDSAAQRLIEAMGLMSQEDGHPRIAGQVLGYLLVEGEPRTLTQLSKALSISKASASTNTRLLESKGMLRRVSHVGSRQDAWALVDHPDGQMIGTIAARFRRNAETMRDLAVEFPDTQGGARERVNGFADFYRVSADFMDEWRERLLGETRAKQASPEDR